MSTGQRLLEYLEWRAITSETAQASLRFALVDPNCCFYVGHGRWRLRDVVFFSEQADRRKHTNTTSEGVVGCVLLQREGQIGKNRKLLEPL